MAVIGGVSKDTGATTGAQLALIPASGGVTQEWARSKVVRGERSGNAGATEDQGWYSQDYDDASAAPVLVYDFTAGDTQKRSIFAWLLLVSPVPFGSIDATAELTQVTDLEVGARVTVGGSTTST